MVMRIPIAMPIAIAMRLSKSMWTPTPPMMAVSTYLLIHMGSPSKCCVKLAFSWSKAFDPL